MKRTFRRALIVAVLSLTAVHANVVYGEGPPAFPETLADHATLAALRAGRFEYVASIHPGMWPKLLE